MDINVFKEMEIKKINDKVIAVYHGLGGGPSPDRIRYLNRIGYDKIIYPYINFEREWAYDRGRSMFYRELLRAESADVLMGFSLGGYLAFELAGVLGKDLVLVNPSIDRSKTRLRIKSFNVQTESNFKNIELFLGEFDDLIDMQIPINYLNKRNIDYDSYIIRGMDHNTPLNYFREIIGKSKLI